MSSTATVVYKPVSLAISVLGGVLAGLVFRQVWSRLGHDETAPAPKDLSHSTREVLIAAAIQGSVFGIVKAGVDRAGARGFRALAHEDPA
ncbi:DUF4235 domain-containing protein [Antrihabitans sp. YC3-6]|uniref:DUF4235 domain-containing protein n=2 Tax=Antrihabitans stalagmiti TaxID=2799499 RepID=A0A934NWL0_9NOCA|nr:DUF4235 domain-containing protein [Antrihabitans stalagmiti]MBJ8342939.1 DUF4235 domain-containing protein [Antrihabitans stalagmiti]